MSAVKGFVKAVRAGRAHRVAAKLVHQSARQLLWEPANHRLGSPSLGELVGSGNIYLSPDDLLATLGAVPVGGPEWEEVVGELARRRAAKQVYGDTFGIQSSSGRLIYSLIRSNRPEHVWETGVADGVSSFFILEAMRRNGAGMLHSTDIRPDVGVLVSDDERSRWDLHLIDRSRPERSLADYARGLPPLDMFIHDSLHRFKWQRLELGLAANRLTTGGLLASDDADSSFAFIDVCAERGWKPEILVDESKVFGMAVGQ